MSASPRSRQTESGLTSEPEDRDAGAPHRGVRVRASLPRSAERSRTAIVLSALLHLLLIAALIRVTASVVRPTHSPIGDAFQLAIGGGGGGGKGGAVNTAPPVTHEPEPVVPPPPPVVAPTVIPPPPAPVTETPVPTKEPAPVASTAAAGTGGGSGGGAGTGTGPGTGSGVGPGSGGGSGGGAGNGRGGSPPENKSLILPPIDPPKPLRGKEFEVTFNIDALGKVIDVLVTPPITDRAFARKFDQIMRGYDWRPARDSLGRAVAGSFTMILSF